MINNLHHTTPQGFEEISGDLDKYQSLIIFRPSISTSNSTFNWNIHNHMAVAENPRVFNQLVIDSIVRLWYGTNFNCVLM